MPMPRHWVEGHGSFNVCCDTLVPTLFCCLRWYLSYQLSYRDLVEMMDEKAAVKNCKIANALICYGIFTLIT